MVFHRQSCLELNYTISAYSMVSSVSSVDTSRLDKKSGTRRVTLLVTEKKVEIFNTFR
ncbi:hypothetical protein BFO01nite_56290 [Brevibacillus formosus]|uniref:Uncharacterized protein n=1 Tax=Brevibacillus formosus TaxID=54913 RepID=A0ABQ0TDZ0_9BACL|nr:hypothetical protein BFO01nite_56290 [Brevibacillus formosus]